MKGKQIILNKPDVILTDLYFSQTNSTLLIAFIGVFMVFISFLGNNGVSAFDKPLKSSILESGVSFGNDSSRNIFSSDLTIGKQIINIGGKEFTVDIIPNF